VIISLLLFSKLLTAWEGFKLKGETCRTARGRSRDTKLLESPSKMEVGGGEENNVL
jgi:hypothetical protein